MSKKGTIGVTTENIFPVIKKFLYSDHEIFLRELVSNAVDATQKLKTLAAFGDFKGTLDDMRVEVTVDKEAGTLTVSDHGIGMTADDIEKYINQIAFSGAEEFLENTRTTQTPSSAISASDSTRHSWWPKRLKSIPSAIRKAPRPCAGSATARRSSP